MQRIYRRLMCTLVLATGLALVGACSSDSISSINIIPKPDLKPDWLSYSGGKEEFGLRPVGAEDLIRPEGQCANAASGPAAAGADEAPVAGAPASGGISLQMTECDVVRRAGAPERVEFGTNERGERTVVLTYVRGSRPAIYRFASGRLFSIERAPGQEQPAKPRKGAPAKKRAT